VLILYILLIIRGRPTIPDEVFNDCRQRSG